MVSGTTDESDPFRSAGTFSLSSQLTGLLLRYADDTTVICSGVTTAAKLLCAPNSQ